MSRIVSKSKLLQVSGGMLEPDAFSTIRHEIEIPIKKEPTNIKIGVFGDVHRDSPACDVAKWHRQLEEWKNEKDMYFIGLGDYLDFSSYSERLILNDPSLHEQTRERFDGWQEEVVNEFVEEIKFMKGRILGFIEGNHYWKFNDGTTSTQRMCQRLDAPYMGITGIIRNIFKRDTGGATVGIDIWCHHGLGASRLIGGSINKVEQMREVFPAMDVYIQGHDHRRSTVPVSCLHINDGGGNGSIVVKQRRQWLIRSGSYLKGYDPGKANYVNRKLLPPSDLGSVNINIAISRKVYGSCNNGNNRTDEIIADITAYC